MESKFQEILHTLTVHVTIKVNSGDVICLDRLNEDTLPDSTARCIEDMTRVKSLLANGNNIITIISRIVHKHQPKWSASCLGFFDVKLTVHFPGPLSDTVSRPR